MLGSGISHPKKIAMIGCGSLGSAFAGLLSKAGHHVSAVCRTADHREAIRRDGLLLVENGMEERVRLHVCEELPAGSDAASRAQFDLVLVLVKSYDTESAAEQLAHALAPECPVLTLQNGLGNAETLAAHLKINPILAGTTTFGAQRFAPGTVALTGRGACEIGGWGNAADACVASTVELLGSAGIPATISHDVKTSIWKKLATSAVINPLTAILRVPNGELLRSPDCNSFRDGVAEIAADIVAEVRRAAEANGIPLPDASSLLAEAQRVCRITAANRSSMLRDIEQNRRTEIDSINGAISRISREHRLASPANRLLAAMIKAMQN